MRNVQYYVSWGQERVRIAFCNSRHRYWKLLRAITEFSAAIGVLDGFMSSDLKQFFNETFYINSRSLKVPHMFTICHLPWSCGAMERLGKELPPTLSSMLCECWMLPKEWPDIVLLEQTALKNAKSIEVRQHLSFFLVYWPGAMSVHLKFY